MPFSGRAGVNGIGDLAGVRVDTGNDVRARHVGPDGAPGPGQVVQALHPGPLVPHVDNAPRIERVRITTDQLTGAVAGENVVTGRADAPALPVVRHLVQQLQGARVPAQGHPFAPGQLPDVRADAADPFTEQPGGQRRTALRLDVAQAVPAQHGLPVTADGFPDRDLARGAGARDQPLRESATGMRVTLDNLGPPEPQLVTSRGRLTGSNRSQCPRISRPRCRVAGPPARIRPAGR